MSYLETFDQETLKKRLTTFPDKIEDIVDLYISLNFHNFFNNKPVNVYKDNIEIYGLGGDEKREEYPYFMDNFFIIYLPYQHNNKSYIDIEFVDYGEPIDVKERNEVRKVIKQILPTIINVDKINFRVRV